MPRRREPWNGRHVAGQPDLVADPTADRAGVERAVGDVGLDLGAGERDHLRLLRGGDRAARSLEGRDAVDAIGIRAGHGGELGEAGDQRGDLGHDRIHRLADLVRSHV